VSDSTCSCYSVVRRCQNKGSIFTERSTGYSNIRKHLESSNWMGKVELEKFIDECLSESNKSDVMQKWLMSSTLSKISPRVQNVHDISRWLVVDHDLPLAALDDDSHRGNSKHADNWGSAKTMRKYLSNMSIIVEVKLKSILPRLFMLNFYGWSHAGIHYLGVMASFYDRDSEHH
jgi:hypothetical protein